MKTEPKRATLAILSLIISILSPFLFVPYLISLSGLTAVVLGILALRKIKQDITLKGKGLAIAGIIIGSLFFLGGYLMDTSLSEEPSEKSELEEKLIEEVKKPLIETHSPCDFLPNENLIPTEYTMPKRTEEEGYCEQQYVKAEYMSVEQFIIKIFLLENNQKGVDTYTEFVQEVKRERGYTETSTNSECFAFYKTVGFTTITEQICNFGLVVLKGEHVSDDFFGGDDELLRDIAENVRNKVKES